ncbi:hypothetical protein CERZMDRAFT_98824 [Cercospora zeae-maydis SCOH1-5]|uniref:Uncharacterized protein n=1 Tax=Cercospora zeae-maydis SCOH1-5 TaxID=717836 RepID=A0A6A6FCN0_9PEZI|nr:hypothetical protein CERZMDRAFT_98824 [Cercospora zeae-maydis SCOH1-5]
MALELKLAFDPPFLMPRRRLSASETNLALPSHSMVRFFSQSRVQSYYLLQVHILLSMNTSGSSLDLICTGSWPDPTPRERLTMYSTNSPRISDGTPRSPFCAPYFSLDHCSPMCTGNQKSSIQLPGLGKGTP